VVGVEGIADWIGREVVDREGEKVGKLADVYYDTADSEPVFVTVKSGTFGRSHSVAPLQGATLARDYVRLDAPKELVKDAPSADAGGRLTGVDASAVLTHYGLAPEPDLEGEERVCFQTAGAAADTERKRAELEAAQAREAEQAREAREGRETREAREGQEAREVQEARETEQTLADERAREEQASEADEVREPTAGAAAGSVVVDRAKAPDRDLVAADPGPEPARDLVQGDRPAAPTSAGDAPLTRLEQLERRVAALEARLG